ncbi:helix-turn-helix domain-containing protein [Micromonospora sp. M12]
MVTPLHRAGGQAQFIPVGTPGEGDELATVTGWASSNLHRPITVTDLARRGVVSTRTLHRSFQSQFGMSPRAWLIQRRLRAACALLEKNEITVDEVARRTGLGTATNLRAHFRRAFATTLPRTGGRSHPETHVRGRTRSRAIYRRGMNMTHRYIAHDRDRRPPRRPARNAQGHLMLATTNGA